jgi:hypothetical protein
MLITMPEGLGLNLYAGHCLYAANAEQLKFLVTCLMQSETTPMGKMTVLVMVGRDTSQIPMSEFVKLTVQQTIVAVCIDEGSSIVDESLVEDICKQLIELDQLDRIKVEKESDKEFEERLKMDPSLENHLNSY